MLLNGYRMSSGVRVYNARIGRLLPYLKYRTVVFAEYNCSGPGSDTSARVNYTTSLNTSEVAYLLDINYIDGLDWLMRSDEATIYNPIQIKPGKQEKA
jgi:hypothetical protein